VGFRWRFAKYISALAGLVRSGRVFVLATLRSDFYASYQEFPDLIELTEPSGKFDLRPPTPSEIGNMIQLPAEAAGLHFEQDLETGQRLDQALSFSVTGFQSTTSSSPIRILNISFKTSANFVLSVDRTASAS
jgi:hypothetical protein